VPRFATRLALALTAIFALVPGARADSSPIEALRGELARRGFSGIVDLRVAGENRFRYASDGRGFTARCAAGSVFWIGSVSKQFAAVAALRLVDRGKLDLDAPVERYLPQLAPALSRDGARCTVAQVLHHTCGLPSSNVCLEMAMDTPAGQTEFVECVAGIALRSKPGARYAYANVGFDLIGVLVARLSGTSYAEFLQRELLRPLQMTHTGVDLRHNPRARQRLVPGQLFAGWGFANTWPWVGLSPFGPGTAGASGNIYSTVDDLHRWNTALHGGRVLEPQSYQRLITPALDDYGLGIGVERSQTGRRWLWHNGSLTPMGWSAFVAYIPSLRASIVGLANRTRHTSHVMRATRALVRTTLGERVSPPILAAPSQKDRTVELLFFVLPLLFVIAVSLLTWELWRGPRQRSPLFWYAKVLTHATLYLFAVSLFDFFGRTVYFAPPLFVVLGLGLVLHRRRLDLELAAAWRDRKQRRKLVAAALPIAVLLFVSSWTARTWFVALLVVEGLLLLLIAPRRPTPRPTSRGRDVRG
jgi:CubicO group peptidase (beta-lactamase class C family)